MIYIVTTYRGAIASVTVTEAYTETKAFKGGASVYVLDEKNGSHRIVAGVTRPVSMFDVPTYVAAAVNKLRAERKA